MATFRKVILANNQIYHVFNRGVERRIIFTNRREYNRAVATANYYRFASLPLRFSKFIVQPEAKKSEILANIDSPKNKLVEIIAYCLMPNHFHFLLKQLQDKGISRFLSNFTNSYAKYFNTRHERSGPLIQGIFKAVLVETDEQLVHVSRYSHLNPVASFVIKREELENYEWSSYREYLGLAEGFCDKEIVLGQFKSTNVYRQFVQDQISYAQELEKIKDLILD